MLHAVAFYLALFGFVYSFETKFYTLSYLAVIAGGEFCSFNNAICLHNYYSSLNIVSMLNSFTGISLSSLLIRIIQELVLIGFYPPAYAVT